VAKKAQSQTITIHAQAPHKPALGETCNGCGVCCAAEPCPVSLALLWPHQAPCRALIWSDQTQRYLCGMVCEPARFFMVAARKHECIGQPFIQALDRGRNSL